MPEAGVCSQSALVDDGHMSPRDSLQKLDPMLFSRQQRLQFRPPSANLDHSQDCNTPLGWMQHGKLEVPHHLHGKLLYSQEKGHEVRVSMAQAKPAFLMTPWQGLGVGNKNPQNEAMEKCLPGHLGEHVQKRLRNQLQHMWEAWRLCHNGMEETRHDSIHACLIVPEACHQRPASQSRQFS